jgi:hypothetical protein
MNANQFFNFKWILRTKNYNFKYFYNLWNVIGYKEFIFTRLCLSKKIKSRITCARNNCIIIFTTLPTASTICWIGNIGIPNGKPTQGPGARVVVLVVVVTNSMYLKNLPEHTSAPQFQHKDWLTLSPNVLAIFRKETLKSILKVKLHLNKKLK